MSDIIAIIAIVVSFGGVVFQIVLESMRRRHEDKTVLYKEAYKSIFLDDIPCAMMKIRYINDVWTGSNYMIDCLSVIRKRSYFFNYVDEKFGESVKNKCQDIEDFLSNVDDRSMTNEKYRKSYGELEEKIKSLYGLVTKRFY